MKQIKWDKFKPIITSCDMSLYLIDYGAEYCIIGHDRITGFQLECVIDKNPSDTTELNDFVNNYLSKCNKQTASISEPFATPTYRTKRTATTSIVTIEPNTSGIIDYQLTAERYIMGGKLIAKNAEFGDYFTAEVYDKDSIIPSQYRSILCENWPSVSTYVEKEWVNVCGNTYCHHEVNAYPLTAKITTGLYLRVTYYTVNSGSNREIIMNYFMTKKL